ncbi:MAG: DinB family protein [Chloroflexota bacterium]|nr:DinB family protein [Chloroflexota bacterium]
MTQETSERVPAATVADLLQRIEDSWSAFLTSLDDLTEDQLQEPNVIGEWSLKELLGHIAFWDDLGRENAALALSGQTREFDDFEEMNQADHAARQGRTLAEERAAMHQAHAALVADLEERAELDATAIDAAIAGATYEHYDEHLADVSAWREQRGV